MTTAQPHNPTTTSRPVRVGGDDYDPFATIPGAYDDYTPPATKPAVQTPTVAVPPLRTLTPVIDCPACVWNDFGATGLDGDFVREWSHAIHAAGTQAVQEPLLLAWRKRGFAAELVCHHVHAKLGKIAAPIDVQHAVAQEAVEAVEGEELVFRANLVDELAAFNDRDF